MKTQITTKQKIQLTILGLFFITVIIGLIYSEEIARWVYNNYNLVRFDLMLNKGGN